ncbi:MAG: glycosyltransferase family 2 protein [Thermoleophilaceae bacterium]
MQIAAIVSFLDEERHLPTLLDSIAAQTRRPDRVLLVDDGSRDGSAALAEAFAREHDHATVLRRPSRAVERDRLAAAPELRSFTWALETLEDPWDVVAKLDADLRLAPGTLAGIEARFKDDPRLGVVGPRLLSVDEGGRDVSHRTRPEHVEGAAKFYRRECLEQISPIPPILGWDTIDEVRARMRGWRTAGGAPDDEPVLHLRPMGARDGAVRAFRRWGACAYAYGEHPLHVLLVGARRLPERPVVLGGTSYVAGWALAALHRAPRAEPELRAYVRRDQLGRLARRAQGRG